MHITQLSLPRGFRIIQKKSTVDLFTAERWLASKRQHRYTEARRCGDNAVLSGHVIICPYCGAELPAYSHFLSSQPAKARVPKVEIHQWATAQLSFWSDCPETLRLYEPSEAPANYRCKKCGKESKPTEKYSNVIVRETRHGLEISQEIIGLAGLAAVLSLKWLTKEKLSFSFPLFETIVFNFRNGHTSLKLENPGCAACAVRNLTFDHAARSGAAVIDLLENNMHLQRLVKRHFIRCCQGSLPFTRSEQGLEAYILMTQFIGYPRSFYDAIPYIEDTRCVDGSFKAAARRLHRYDALPALYRDYELPNVKSARRVYFQTPSLFFYAQEGATLWRIIKDINLFCRVLSSVENHSLLAMLHIYPGLEQCYADYAEVVGAKRLCDMLINDPNAINEYVLRYCMLNGYQRRLEQKRWHREGAHIPTAGYCNYLYPPLPYSLPMLPPADQLKSCSITGYRFQWLRSTAECKAAGKALCNCLGAWYMGKNVIIVMLYREKIVAAIELDGKRIIQAEREHNESLEDDSEMFAAFEIWRRQNRLTYSDGLAYEMDELPY